METNGTRRPATKDGTPHVIKLGEAAQIINCSYSTALWLARSGELKAFRVRGAWRTTDVICAEYIEQRIAELTGLTEKQVSRGVAELRRLNIIVPITRKAKDGTRHIDRSCFGHVATYCFTKDAWQLIEDGFEGCEQRAAEGEQGERHSKSAGRGDSSPFGCFA